MAMAATSLPATDAFRHGQTLIIDHDYIRVLLVLLTPGLVVHIEASLPLFCFPFREAQGVLYRSITLGDCPR